MKALPTGLSTAPKSLPARGKSFIRVALDIPLATLFDYSVPESMEAGVGDRVCVPFGERERVGVVVETSANATIATQRVKEALERSTDAPS